MFLERLGNISARIDGAIALSLVDHDGIAVESVSSSADLDLDAVAAELVAQVRAISSQQQELSVGEVQQFTVVAERMSFVVSRVTGGYFLLLALTPSGSLGRARFELRRASLTLEDELT
jgi:predicted regulator of Ras-like GTPase activity (Roadblock/LC7/MglB family)